MPDRLLDLAIVGGGTAGAAAALRALALDPGLRVAIFDPAAFPRDKPCGDGIGPEAAALLHRLGAASALDGCAPVDRVRIAAPDGVEVAGRVPEPGYVVERTIFDARLVVLAVARGATLVRERIREVRQRARFVVLNGQHAARLVVGADGANSAVRRAVAGPQPRGHTALAMRGYAPAPGGPPELRFWFVPQLWPAYAWSFPLAGGRANIGYGTFDARLVASRGDLIAGLDATFPHLAGEVDGLRAYHLPLATRRPDPARDRVLLAGDAAALVNPLSGEGIHTALLSGALAGACAARYGAFAGPVYRRALRSRLSRHHRHLAVVARAFVHPTSVAVGVAAARGHPEVLAHLFRLAVGTGTVTPALVRRLVPGYVACRAAP